MTVSELTQLRGDRVTVREFRGDDVDAVYAVIGDERVTRTLSFDPRTREQSESMIANTIASRSQRPRTEYYLAIALPDDGALVGFVRLALGGVQAAKLGFAVNADHWGKGYATDAAALMIRFGFEQLRLHRITAAVGPENTASHATIQRLGFTQEGTLRDHVFTNGAWRNSVLYSILRPPEVAEDHGSDPGVSSACRLQK
jgi:RimJ/RimL family protein N-acetyltransferase